MKGVFLRKKLICRSKLACGLRAMVGLMFRPSLKKGEALILELPKKKVDIHSFFMFFPISLYFLDECFRVIETADLTPWKVYLPKNRPKYVLEANMGELSLKVGDRLEIRDK
jgi:uncharacterized membrane protein (UPF0127 family)